MSPQTQIKELVRTVQEPEPAAVVQESRRPPTQNDAKLRRVFITHGKNTAFIEPIKELLGFGELIPVVSIQKESVAQPVPDKVMNDMRGCGAAIIHVDGEMKLLDSDAKEHTVINPNVLTEIGAAMALYGRRFILLVDCFPISDSTDAMLGIVVRPLDGLTRFVM